MKRHLACLFASAVLSLPAENTPPPDQAHVPGQINLGVQSARAATPTAASHTVTDECYLLRVGDKLSFQILEDNEAPKSLVVADSGEIELPYLGRVRAAGITCGGLTTNITTLLEADFYYHATVKIAVDQANRYWGRVYVWGQVKNQGTIEIAATERLTAGKAILRAGGFSEFANRRRVRLTRSAQAATAGNTAAVEPTHATVFELDMIKILEEGRSDLDMPLEPEDSILVKARLINF